MKLTESLKNGIKAQKYSLGLAWDTAPLACAFSMTAEYINSFLPYLTAYLWKVVIDELQTTYSSGSAAPSVWGFLALFVAMGLLHSILNYGNRIAVESLGRKTKKKLNIQLMERLSGLECSFFDNPANQDMMNKVNLYKNDVEWTIINGSEVAVELLSFVGGLILFLPYHPILGILYILTFVPGSLVQYQEKRKMDLYSIESIPECRKKDYYKSLLTEGAYAKDLRMYDLSGFFMDSFNGLWNSLRKRRDRLFREETWRVFGTTLLSLSGFIALIIWSARSVLLGETTLGVLAFYLTLSNHVGKTFNGLTFALPFYINMRVPRILAYKEFVEKTQEDGQGTEEGSACKISASPSIEFRDVCFRYPSSEKYAIDHLSFRISGKEKAAIVGANGAGKSTVIKLLLRFYEPQSGQILLDGVDIRRYPVEDVRRCFSVCFQDIQRYSLTFRENIALSDISRIGDTEGIKDAARRSGADAVYEKFQGDIDFSLTCHYDDGGYEPSGGQWQKIAIARTFYRNSGFVILDEPSSELDPEAEDRIFRQFGELVADKGGIVISHRLSFLRLVDKIIFLRDGSLAGSGTHGELMRENEEYARMYNMQALKYGKESI